MLQFKPIKRKAKKPFLLLLNEYSEEIERVQRKFNLNRQEAMIFVLGIDNIPDRILGFSNIKAP